MDIWTRQDNLEVSKHGKRAGGPYFMHGNNPKLTLTDEGLIRGEDDIEHAGFTFHFTRSRYDFEKHINSWTKLFGQRGAAQARGRMADKDNNDVKDQVLSAWSCKIRDVIRHVTDRELTGASCDGATTKKARK